MIEVEGVGVSFDGRTVIEDISFSTGERGVVAILGPNGAGKTTLLRCMNGLLRPQSGSVRFRGEDIFRLPRRRIAELMAFVPQHHIPSFPYTVFDFVLTGRAPYIGLFSTPSASDREAVRDSLRRLGIARLSERAYTRVSGGELRLILIARALAQEPKLLLLDEPTAHLDFKNKIKILSTVRELTLMRGITTVVSIHDPNDVSLFADRVVVVSNGKLVVEGEPSSVITPSLIREVYGVEVDGVDYRGRRVILPSLDRCLGGSDEWMEE